MPNPDDIPDLDALARVTETLQERIKRHHETIASNEIRTRTALIDPLLNALGWDTADPAMVVPEYAAGNGMADYALLKTVPDDGPQVIAFIEAKRLNEDLRPHRPQMLNYANMEGVRYAGLTNGDRWELYEIFKEAPLDERRIVDVSLSRDSATACAVNLLPLKWPYLETGKVSSLQDPTSLLFYTIRTNGPGVIETLLGWGADIAATDNNGWTPLHCAVAYNPEPEVAVLLLDWGADTKATGNSGETPLHSAARENSNPAVIALLLARGADIEAVNSFGETPLHIAAGTARPGIVEMLLKYGADPLALTNDGRTAYQVAKARGADEKVLNLLRSSNFLDSEFWESCTPEEVEAELNRGADIMARSTSGKTPLHLAVEAASPEIVVLLLDSGADVAATDEDGWSPLHVAAARNEDPEVVELLLDRGADIAATDYDGWTPLHCAVAYNPEPAVTELLLDSGGDRDAVTGNGETLSQLAGSVRVLWLLREPDENFADENFWRHAGSADVRSQLNRGADLAIRTNDGATILHLAAKWSTSPSAVAELLGRGMHIEARDSKGWTPLHKAALNDESPSGQLLLFPDPLIGTTVIETLLKHGADPYALTDDGQTAYQIAKARGADEETLMLFPPAPSGLCMIVISGEALIP